VKSAAPDAMVSGMIEELKAKRARLDRAIAALEAIGEDE
jgi:hypothetical protein